MQAKRIVLKGNKKEMTFFSSAGVLIEEISHGQINARKIKPGEIFAVMGELEVPPSLLMAALGYIVAQEVLQEESQKFIPMLGNSH